MSNFTTSLDPNTGIGIPVFQHRGYDLLGYDLALRAGIVAVRVGDRDDKEGGIGNWMRDPGPDNDPTNSVGDLNCAFLWPRASRQINGWAFAFPATTYSADTATASGGKTCAKQSKDSTMLPLIGYTMDPDGRYKPLKAHRPKRKGKQLWPKIPNDWIGIALNSTFEAEQIEYFHPTDPRLVAVNRKGDAAMGSWVCDMGANFETDPDFYARLQSAFRVVRPKTACIPVPDDDTRPGKKHNGIAWQLMPAHCDQVWGRGLVIDRSGGGGSSTGGAGGGSDTIVALASKFETGPLFAGLVVDKHKVGMTEDGQPINSLHIPTGALFHQGSYAKDAPLEFSGDWIIPTEGPLYVPVELRYDVTQVHDHVCGAKEGLWRWEAKTFVYGPPTEGPDPKIPKVPPRPGVPTEGSTFYPNDSGEGKITRPTDVEVEPPSPYYDGSGAEAFAATPMQFAAPVLLGRPQELCRAVPDLRTHQETIYWQDLLRLDSKTPMTGRIEAFGAGQDGCGAWDYTTSPTKSRFRGGTADGGFVLLPPEVSIDDHGSSYAPAGRSRSTTYLAVGPGAYFAAGLPDLTRGDVDTGYRWGASSGKLVFDQVSAAGVVTANVVTMDTNARVGIRTATPRSSFDVAGTGGTDWTGEVRLGPTEFGGSLGLIVGTTQRANIGFMMIGRNLNGVSGADTYQTTYTQSVNVGYSALEFLYSSNAGVRIFGDTGNTTAGTVVTPREIARMTIAGVTFNEDAGDIDFRVESTTDANAIFVDASTGGITLGPSASGLRINNQADAAGAGIGTIRNTPNPLGGDPAFWLPVNIGGTVYAAPFWSL